MIKTYQDIDKYQKFVRMISDSYKVDPQMELPVVALGLAGETGEVTELLKKYLRDGNIDRKALQKELGDVLAYLCLIADMMCISMQDVMDGNVEKLQGRLERGTLRGSGNDR